MRFSISDQWQSRSYLAPFSHNKSLTDRQTDDDERQPCHKLDRYLYKYGRLKTLVVTVV